MVSWSRCLCRLPALVLALTLVLGSMGTALADQNDPALDGLFRDLKAAQSPQEVRRIEAQIWTLWFDTGSEQMDRMLLAGDRAMSAGRFDQSYAILNGVIEHRPDLSEGWNRRATLRYLMGDYDGSIADIGETLEREPRHFGALSGLGLCNIALGNEEAALDAFERALVHNPHMPGVQRRVKQLRERLGRHAI
ncbi:MAG: tetratricopeptide repeat protein [Rhodospirillales bacterium]|nr:tetratricopeptide repeat protein [Rhodospirillales bacterium]MDE0381308.1 tetratricopeptide repeat protein [Rhodospirillales bacterium]